MACISERGRTELELIRVGKVPPVAEKRAPVELLAALPSEDCGCPEELWMMDGIIYLIHFEQDSRGEITSFHGEYEGEQFERDARTFGELRAALFHAHQEIIERPERA